MNELINERIINATKELFSTTFRTEIEAGSPYLLETDSTGSWDTSGVISITGSYYGLIAVRFQKSLPENLLKAVQIIDMNSVLHDRLLNDMVGEITNIVTGNVFSDTMLGEVLLSIPVTIQGKNHIISWSRDPRITVIPFCIGKETFVVETEFKKS